MDSNQRNYMHKRVEAENIAKRNYPEIEKFL